MPKICEERGSDYLWLKVTYDKYEFPLYVADSVTELARVCGKTEGAIRSAVCHAEKRNSKSMYRRVKK